MKHASLYFHYPCFDGLVSGVLAWDFLDRHEGWTINEFLPVDYTLRDAWLKTKLKKPCAVVDFLYHPGATFWADHHETTFLDPRSKASYQQRKDKSRALYDNRSPSCATLLYRHFRKSFSARPHFKELVKWAQKIDSAAYSSVEEAILGDAPALQINRSLLAEDLDRPGYARFLITQLREHDLTYVASLKEVQLREKKVRRSLERGLKKAKAESRLEAGDIVVLDARKNSRQLVSRYAPYFFQPNARYSIGIVRTPDLIGITAMRNPWRKFRSVSLGRALEKFGGGGHQRVGAVRLPASHRKQADAVVESLLAKMRKDRGASR